MADLNLNGMALADGVVETIVSIALADVEGVSTMGAAAPTGILAQLGSKPATQGIEVETTDDGKLSVGVHLEVAYGYALPTVADQVRSAIADAVAMQVGVDVANVDVYIDSIQF